MVTDKGGISPRAYAGSQPSCIGLRTTPYQTKANGLVEHFNGTLKTLPKTMCQERPRLWDRYLAPLLSGYWKVPKAIWAFPPLSTYTVAR